MLLFRGKAVVRIPQSRTSLSEEEEEEEEEEERIFGRLATFRFSTFTMYFHTTKSLVGHGNN